MPTTIALTIAERALCLAKGRLGFDMFPWQLKIEFLRVVFIVARGAGAPRPAVLAFTL
jgi:hypothetical protein